ncbi:MAG: FAD-binding oxidoreductase [Nitrosopumilaceae archaeon]|nr:FAD-binding oxidoreductase [Nitrosopumilaceae archaeon]
MNLSEIRKKLEKTIKGQVLWDDAVLDYYSVDSSAYKIKPKVVVIPKNLKDIVLVLRFASQRKISVTPRGTGTGLVGSALGDGIILDMKNFDKIKISKNHVEVDAGALKGNLDKELLKHGKFFGPNPSVGPYCTVGGMIATNASGSRSLKYGSMIDNLLEVTLVTGTGDLIKLPSKTKYAEFIVSVANSVDKSTFPQVSKNSCGYRLDAINNQNESQKIIAGSEGTLGVVVSAKLKIRKIPQRRSLLILGYDSVIRAAHDCQNLIKLKPSALEFVDHNTMKNFKASFLRSINCLLFIEFDENIKQSIAHLNKISDAKILHKLDNESEIQKWWKYRDSALYYSMKKVLPKESMPHIIEDATVPVSRLAELFSIADMIRKKLHAKIIMYGHAGNGNIHVRLIFPNKSKKAIKKIATWFFTRIVKIGGTITGEHGDGLARSEFVKLQYGKKTYLAFNKIKQRFDPYNILNQDKIITDKSTVVSKLAL